MPTHLEGEVIMKRFGVAALVISLFASVARSSKPNELTGEPNPPFQGEPPEQAYIFEGGPGKYGGQLVLDLKGDPRTFNIIQVSDENSAYLLYYHVFRWLIDFRNGGNPPDYDSGLCTHWEVTPDVKQYTFYLRRGVRWSDGQPFTADDVLFTYDVIRDKNVANSIRDTFTEGTDADGNPIYPQLVKINDHAVRFTLSKANSLFLDSIVNLFPIPKHKWEQTWREGKFNEVMGLDSNPADIVSLGPFRLKEYSPGQRIVLERNPYFWKVDQSGQRLPYLDRVIFVIAQDFTTVQSKFLAGEIDIVSRVRAEDYAAVQQMKQQDPNVIVHDIGVVLNTEWIVFNQNNSINPNTKQPFLAPWKQRLFRNQKFRQAISYALDREAIANTVYAGRAMPNWTFSTPADKMWHSNDVMTYPYDVARAKQMLAEIGLRDTNGDGALEDQDGNTIEFTIHTNSTNSQRIRTAAFIIRSLQDVGIRAHSRQAPLKDIADIMEKTFNFDALVLGWGSGVPPGPTNSKNILLSSGGQHACFVNQAKPSTEWEARVDQLVHEIESIPDRAVQKQKYAEIQRIWSEQLPEINLVVQQEAVAFRNKFGNVVPSPMSPRATWNIEEIYIKR
jgi:peptide/nickel transport system substrate-binding protein